VNMPPIGDYALLSDARSSALVSRAGSIDWMCPGRFDAPSVFGRLLDDTAGHWSLAPREWTRVTRRYVEDTMVLETTFHTSTGAASVEDALALGGPDPGHELGALAPGVLVRRVGCTEGTVDVEMEWAPRPEYGLITPLLSVVEGGVRARGGASALRLSFTEPASIEGSTLRARFSLRAGAQRTFALQHRSSWEEPLGAISSEAAHGLLDETIQGWQGWSAAHRGYEGPWADLVAQSGRVLQALMYRPTGAIVAAPTTSLPEVLGGERNWDYRYAWVRDASLTLEALAHTACPAEAKQFFKWVAEASAAALHAGAELQIMFGVGGEHDLSERVLPHLGGYRESRPVRVGNDAWRQRQLDVYGELLDAAAHFQHEIAELDDESRHFLADAADTAAARWTEDDEGIWEVRGEPRPFLHSKLMCWVALDRAIRLAPTLGASERVGGWIQTRDEIRAAIEAHGWNDRVGAFTRSFGSDDLDAAVLMMPIVGFIAPDDPRMHSTLDAVARELTDERGLVLRYRSSDGLQGEEGAFLPCTFWLAQAQAMAGRLDEAHVTFECAASHANDLGLLSEEVDGASGELLGNFPQAFTHVGLINAAWAMAVAEGSAPDEGGPAQGQRSSETD
jgi:GH15 family glucan-1,4-alpha-glucosidase